MQVAVRGKQFRIGDTLREHIETAVTRIAAKYFGNPLDAAVTVTRDGSVVRADISVHVGRRIQIRGHGQASEPYAAFDAANEKIDKQLRRFKRRIRDHHQRGTEPEEVDAQEVVFAARDDAATPESPDGDGEWQPVVVAEMTTNIRTLSVEEAVMHMELADAPVLLFQNAAHDGLNVVFRRADGNIGWIDPLGRSA